MVAHGAYCNIGLCTITAPELTVTPPSVIMPPTSLADAYPTKSYHLAIWAP